MSAAPGPRRRAAAHSPKETLKQARRDVHRQHLVDAAEAVFALRGYEGTRMQEVAARAGLALGTVYGLFPGKEQLYAEVHRVRGRALIERAFAASHGAGSAWEGLRAGVRAYAEYLIERPDYLKLHLQESQPWALHPRFTSGEQGRLWQEGVQLAVEMFRVAIAEGAVVDESPALLARLMIAAHQVFLGEWVDAGMREPKAALVERMHAHLDRAFKAPKKRARR